MAKKILIVDDSVMLLKLYRKALLPHGFEVDTWENGREALLAMKSQNYDLILTDLNMPLMNGIEFLKAVRKSEDHAETPVVMVSSDSVGQRKTEAKEAGASGWITKPFDPAKLLAQVNHFL